MQEANGFKLLEVARIHRSSGETSHQEASLTYQSPVGVSAMVSVGASAWRSIVEERFGNSEVDQLKCLGDGGWEEEWRSSIGGLSHCTSDLVLRSMSGV